MTYSDDDYYEDISEMPRREVRRRAAVNRNRNLRYAMSLKPEGWSLQWLASRTHSFEIHPDKKLIQVPMPKTKRGLAVMLLAMDEARRIDRAMQGMSPGTYEVKAPLRGSGPVGWLLIRELYWNRVYDLQLLINRKMAWMGIPSYSYNNSAYNHATYNGYHAKLSARLIACIARARLRAMRMRSVWHGMTDKQIVNAMYSRGMFLNHLGLTPDRYPLPAGVKAAYQRGLAL